MKLKFAAVAAFALVLSACSGGDPEVVISPTTPDASLTPGQPSPTYTPAEPSDVYVNTTDSQGVGEYVGAAMDVIASTCEADGATWVGSGTVQNPTEGDVNYRVWVAFVDGDNETVGLVQANVDGLGAGDTGDYTTSMPYTDAGALTCVLRVERRIAD